MKFSLIFALVALTAPLAHAYNSQSGVDPRNNTSGRRGNEIETKSVLKSATASASEALVPGIVVSYDTTAQDGYTVTRAVPQTLAGQNMLACVVLDTVATGDVSYHDCAVKGYTYVRYDATTYKIDAGIPVCVDAGGKVRGCARSGSVAENTANTGIIPLATKTDSGGALPVMLNLQ